MTEVISAVNARKLSEESEVMISGVYKKVKEYALHNLICCDFDIKDVNEHAVEKLLLNLKKEGFSTELDNKKKQLHISW